MKIALCLNHEDELESFTKGSKINIYEKIQGNWHLNQHIPYFLEKINRIEEMRNEIESIAGLLDDCKILIATKISGIIYTVFETGGFDIWEMDATPEEALNSFSLIENQAEETGSEKIKAFQDLGEGIYEINLTKVMGRDNNATSKSLLLPFLQDESFFKLHVICSHVPPWFDSKLQEMSLVYKVYETMKGEYLVEISKKICRDFTE